MREKCPHCGATLAAIVDAFCPECRQRLDEQPAEEEFVKPIESVVSVDFRYKTFWPRFWAGTLDGLFLVALTLLLTSIFSWFDSVFARLLEYMVLNTACLAYSIWMHGEFGQTLGKMACRIRVVDVSERPLSMHQAAMRDIYGIVLFPLAWAIEIPRIMQGIDIADPANITRIDIFFSNLALYWFIIEVVTMLTNRKRRALHDYIARSVVVRTSNAPLY